MAELLIDGVDLVVSLTPMERVGAFRHQIRVPLAQVTGVHVSPEPFAEVRGMGGTGFPGVMALGTYHNAGSKDFDAVYKDQPAVVVELAEGEFARLIVSSDDAELDVLLIQDRIARMG